MTELTLNIPPPSTFALDKQPGINPDLICESVASGNIDYLISLFDYQRRALNRAETLSQLYFNQMEILHKRLENERRGESNYQNQPTHRANPKPRQENIKKNIQSPTLDMAIDL